MSEQYHLHRRTQDNFSHKTKLESYAVKMKGVLGQEQVSRGHRECCDHQMSGNCGHTTRTGYVVNITPAHMPQAHSGSFHQHLRYQAMPNSHTVQRLQESPMHKIVEPPRNLHGDSSLGLPAPHHSQHFHYSRLSNNHNQQRPPLEHLNMSASSSFSTCNSGKSSSFISHHSLNCSAAEYESDQPINYSLKDLDASSSYRDSTMSSRDNLHMDYDYLASGDGGLNFRPDMVPENLRSTALKGYNCLWNNSTACDKLATPAKGGGIQVNSLNTSTPAPRKPAPNLNHGQFHTPNDYQSIRVPYHQHSNPQFMTPQAPHTNASFHPRGSLYTSSRSVQNTCANLQPNVAVSHSGYSSKGQMLNTGAYQNHNLQTAHQNVPRSNLVKQLSSTYPETDLDIIVDQLTNFSLRHEEVLEDKLCDDRTNKLINYSAYSQNGGDREEYDVCTYRDKRHYVNCKYTDMLPNDSSNCDQVRTFCTEGTLNLSTAVSFTDLTQAGTIEGKEKIVGTFKQIKGTSGRNSTVSSTHIIAANVSGHQTPARQTGSTVIAACKGLGLGTVTPKCTSQLANDHNVHENFYSCVDFNEAALDQTKTYCEEGTPINFSPVSSHSSMYSSDPGEIILHVQQNRVTDKIKLSCIGGETGIPKSLNKSVIGNKRTVCPMSKPATNFRDTNTEQALREDLKFTSVACHDNNQVEETPLMFSRSSSPQSLNSCDIQSIHSSVASEYSWKTNDIVSPSEVPDSPSELMPPCQEQTHSVTKQLKDIILPVKLTSVDTNHSLNFKKTQSMAGACDDPAPGEKSINFARRNAEIQVCSEFDDNQQIDLSSVQGKQTNSHLISTMLLKVIQSANNQNAHLMNTIHPSQARGMSVVEEQDIDTESSYGRSEDFVEFAEEGTPQEFSETTSLSAITFDSSVKDDMSEFSNFQLQPQESGLVTEEEREPGSPIVDGQEAPAIFSVAMESELVKDEVKHKDRNITVSDEDRNITVSDEVRNISVSEDRKISVSKDGNISVSDEDRNSIVSDKDSDSSVSDVSQEEENILAQCISSGMPTSITSTYKVKRTRQPKIPVKTGPDAFMKHPAKIFSMPKTAPKKLATFFNSLPEIVKVDDNVVAVEDRLQLDIPKNEAGSELAEHKADLDGRTRSPSSNFSSSSCSSTNLPVTQFRKNLKQIGGNIESPESRVRLGAVFELSDECSLLEQAYFESVPLQLRSAL